MVQLECRCIECGLPAKVDEERSSENWEAYENECRECGGQNQIRTSDFWESR